MPGREPRAPGRDCQACLSEAHSSGVVARLRTRDARAAAALGGSAPRPRGRFRCIQHRDPA
eukprot:15480994-Alexandrium_andersonii.AAC.1